MDIISAIQQQVDLICEEKYGDDKDSPPVFTVSLLYEDSDEDKKDKDHKICLTISHMESSFTKVIFPKKEQVFGYDSLEEDMKYLYNRTM